jgi:hypothetical protein
MKKRLVVILVYFILTIYPARLLSQMAGSYTVPGSFPSIAAVTNSLNSVGIAGSVTINIMAGHTETVPVGGLTLSATGTSLNSITFKKIGSGLNPKLVAYTGGIATSASAIQDGVWKFIGSDYITIDGIDITDPNLTNPSTMEYGYGFFKASTTNGCRFNLLKNCTITLNRINNGPAASAGPANAGSRGIDMVNALANTHTVDVNVFDSLGSNSFNKFYTNIIQNCNIGISIYGEQLIGNNFARCDRFNDVGGNNLNTGNTIINYGGAPGATNTSYAINTWSQINSNISFNLINNNNGSGVDHPFHLYGIFEYWPKATSLRSVNNNTITLKVGSSNLLMNAIESNGASATFTIGNARFNGNLITNCLCTYTSGAFNGIKVSGVALNVDINNNVFSNNSTAATNYSYVCIYPYGAAGGTLNVSNNAINATNFTSSLVSTTFFGIYGGAATTTALVNVNSNSIQAVNYSGTLNADFYFINAGSSGGPSNINNNRVINLSVPSQSNIFVISNPGPFATVSGNSITTLNKTIPGNMVCGYYCPATTNGTTSISNNDFSNVTLTGNTHFYGVLHKAYAANNFCTISNNTVNSISTGSLGIVEGFSVEAAFGGGIIENNLISNLTGESVHGVAVELGRNVTIRSNTLHTFLSPGSNYGIYLNAMTKCSIKKNRIYDLESTTGGMVKGMLINSDSVTDVVNNLVGDLRAPVSGGQYAIIGMDLSGSSLSSTLNVHYNTVYLDAVSTITAFGSIGLHGNAGLLQLNNNLIVNKSQPNGYLTIALTTSLVSNYSPSSNNNVFSVGSPGMYRQIFCDGYYYPSFAAIQATLSPRESNSFEETPAFITLNGAQTFFLKPAPTASTNVDGGAIPIQGITDDYIGTVRNTSAPDIGAWEDTYINTLITELNIKRIKIFPNPSRGEFILYNPNNDLLSYEVYDITGVLIFKNTISLPVTIIDLKNYSEGLYFVRLKETNGEFSTSTIIKD